MIIPRETIRIPLDPYVLLQSSQLSSAAMLSTVLNHVTCGLEAFGRVSVVFAVFIAEYMYEVWVACEKSHLPRQFLQTPHAIVPL